MLAAKLSLSSCAKRPVFSFYIDMSSSIACGRSAPHLIWELFDEYLLSGANYYWRTSYGLRSANAIESGIRQANNSPEQNL